RTLPSLYLATAATQTYTLSLHDALPIYSSLGGRRGRRQPHAKPIRRQVGPAAKAVTSHRTPKADMTTLISLDMAPRHGARSNQRSEEHTSELQSRVDLVCRLLLEKKK